MIFHSRSQAGEKLAGELLSLALRDPFILAIPRGGVPVASSVAKVLGCPHDVIPLIKVSVPWSPEASYGAITLDGTTALNMSLIHRLELSEREIEMACAGVMQEVQRRDHQYRNGRPFPLLDGKSVVIVDDGLGSGYSMLAAVDFALKRKPRMIVAASPVASDMAYRMLAEKPQVNLIIALIRDPEPVFSLESYYKEFTPVTDDEVVRFLSLEADA
jgi:predicted phosphoribosyltransferase